MIVLDSSGQSLSPEALGDKILFAFQTKSFNDFKTLFMDTAENKNRMEFERLIKKGEKIGIDWTNIRKSDFIFREDSVTNPDRRSMGGFLNVISNKTHYVIFGIKAIDGSSGYKITGIRTVLAGMIEEYIDPDKLESDIL